MICEMTRERCSHAPLEILRRFALAEEWNEARQTCGRLVLSESADTVDLELVLAIWARDAQSVCAAIAKAEIEGAKRVGVPL